LIANPALLDGDARRAGTYHLGRQVLNNGASGGNYSSRPNRNPWTDPYVARDPDLILDNDWNRADRKSRIAVVVVSRTDIGFCEITAFAPTLNVPQAIERDVITYPTVVSNRHLPGIGDFYNQVEFDSSSDVCPKDPQYESPPCIAELWRWIENESLR